MTRVTDIKSKSGLYELSENLKGEFTSLQTEINSIKTQLSNVTDYDGMNFTGAANTISNNLSNVLTSFETLKTNVNGYITELEEFDKYEEIGEDIEIEEPSLEIPTTSSPTEVETIPEEKPVVEDKSQGTPQEELKLEEKPVVEDKPQGTPQEELKPEEKPVVEDKPQGTQQEELKPEEKPVVEDKPQGTLQEEVKPEEKLEYNPTEQTPQPVPTPSQSQPSSSQSGEISQTFEPIHQTASGEIKYSIGDSNIDVSKFVDDATLGYTVTTGNMSYELSTDDYNLLCAIVAAESDGTYDNTLSVISTILNRCENSEWKGLYGMDPISQITAPNQFDAYTSGDYRGYVGNTSSLVEEVVNAALSGVRNHQNC